MQTILHSREGSALDFNREVGLDRDGIAIIFERPLFPGDTYNGNFVLEIMNLCNEGEQRGSWGRRA